jgi:Fe-S oxidoreductase
MQAQQNVETLKGRKFKRIVTQCPHCLHVLGAEYPQFGGAFDVVSHVPFLLELLASGRLKLGPGDPLGETTYHDSCYLGRYRGIYDAPRELLSRLNGGAPPREAERNRDRSFCCGAGGGRMWLEETLGDRINLARYDQLAPPGGGLLATACPYCLTMLDDSVKDRGQEEKVKVRDLAELVAARLGGAGGGQEVEK